MVKIPEERNTPRNIDAIQNYTLGVQFIKNEDFILLDETELDLYHTSWNYCYSPKNSKAYKLFKENIEKCKPICWQLKIQE